MTGQIFSYSLTSGIVLVCLYICYKLTLSRTTFFRFNRLAIMVIYLLSAVAPLVSIEVRGSVEIAAEALIAMPLAVVDENIGAVVSPMKYILIVYLVGMVLMALRLVADMAYLLFLKFSASRVRIDGVEIRVHGNEKLAPFSWGGDIFMPASMIALPEEDLKMIIEHERSHLANRHWLDLVVSNVAVVLQWYNPAAWLLHGELIKVHEFEADRHVLDCTTTPSEYQLLLIKRTAGSRFHTIADSLNHSSLKNRITMMMKNQTKSRARLRALAMLPAIAVALCLTNSSCVKSACEKAEAENITEAATNQIEEATQSNEEELEAMRVVAYGGSPDAAEASVDEITVQAEYPGGYDELYRFLAETINFVGDEGKVLVGFTIDKEGNLNNPHIIKGISEAANNEAIRVVKALASKWTPAKDADGNTVASKFVLPIDFVVSKAPGNCKSHQQ